MRSRRQPTGSTTFRLIEDLPDPAPDTEPLGLVSRKSPLFLFDYVDPRSRLMDHRLAGLTRVDDAPPALGSDDGPAVTASRVERIPFELAPPGAPMIRAADPDWQARWVEAGPWLEEAGLVTPPRIPLVPRTRKAAELALFAAERGAFDRVHRILFDAHLSRGLDIGRVDVLVDLAAAAGLDRSEAKAVLDVDRYAAEVDATRLRATELGVTTVPTVVVGGRRLEGVVEIAELKAWLAGND